MNARNWIQIEIELPLFVLNGSEQLLSKLNVFDGFSAMRTPRRRLTLIDSNNTIHKQTLQKSHALIDASSLFLMEKRILGSKCCYDFSEKCSYDEAIDDSRVFETFQDDIRDLCRRDRFEVLEERLEFARDIERVTVRVEDFAEFIDMESH